MPINALTAAHPLRVAGFAAVLIVSLAACSTAPAAPEYTDNGSVPTPLAQPPVVAVPPTTAAPVATAPIQPPSVISAETPPVPDVITALLSYADRLHALSPTDLAAEIVVQGDPGNVALRQMQLALALMHLRQPADTARSLGLLQRVITHTGPESLPLKPLARLLANRLAALLMVGAAVRVGAHDQALHRFAEAVAALRALAGNLRAAPEMVGEQADYLRRWLAGETVNWAQLYPVAPPRLHLPTYPFDRKSYWGVHRPVAHVEHESLVKQLSRLVIEVLICFHEHIILDVRTALKRAKPCNLRPKSPM